MSQTWPWLALAGLGAFHGLNPAMGWLFAVALGLHRRSLAVVFLSIVPIALGHALSIGIIAAILVATGFIVPPVPVRIAAGLLLISWALYYWRFGHRHRVRFGLQTGLLGLFAWSFLMSTAHGAGLMLWPALMPLCFPEGAAHGSAGAIWGTALAGVAVHTGAMLLVTTVVAVTVYVATGVAFLRQAWINIDAIWLAALVVTGAVLLVE